MKQVLHHIGTGALGIQEVPAPVVTSGRLLVANAHSLISPGTERATREAAEKSLIGKAKARPDLVRQVVRTARDEGIGPTVRKVRDRLDEMKPLGYSTAGEVLEVGDGCRGYAPGDQVACAGGGHAVHAEVVSVPHNLCAPIPDGVETDQAAYTTLGAIALHGVRQAGVNIGERIGVLGLGLVGQLTLQTLKAAGCYVLGIDRQEGRCELSRSLGADEAGCPIDSMGLAENLTRGAGLDAVLITASTPSNEPMQLAADLMRDRGRVVVVGDVGMNLERDPFYQKELDVRLSRSYGPGRYDPDYEEAGHDYPIGFVRWTEQRNMSAFLDLLAAKKVDVARLTTHQFAIDEAPKAYQLIKEEGASMGILLTYEGGRPSTRVDLSDPTRSEVGGGIRIGFIGAGHFAQTYLIPAVKKAGEISLSTLVTRSGSSARKIADKHGFSSCATDKAELIHSSATDVVFIATRHGTHAALTRESLLAGKHVFVEKPLALTRLELSEVVDARSGGLLQVGFNRRFAPLGVWAKQQLVDVSGPLSITYRVNAGRIPPDHWIRDEKEGGGRILGEVCHFVDFVRFLTGSPTVNVFSRALRVGDTREERDNVHVQLCAEDGSVASVIYQANGDRALQKERIEVSGSGVTVVIEDYSRGWLYKDGKKSRARVPAGRGHREEVEAFLNAVRTGSQAPIPFEELVESTLATLAVVESLNQGRPVDLDQPTIE